MPYTTPVRYPNALEQADPEGALNTYVIDNIAYLKANSGATVFAARTNSLSDLGTDQSITSWPNIYVLGSGVTQDAGLITLPNGVYRVQLNAVIKNQNGTAKQVRVFFSQTTAGLSNYEALDYYLAATNGQAVYASNYIHDNANGSANTLAITTSVAGGGSSNVTWSTPISISIDKIA